MWYNSLNEALRRQYGGKVYKLALSAVRTCPNRDGTVGDRGCIFCTGAGEFAESGPIPLQLDRAKARLAGKVPPGTRYIAYFQSFTNTYAPVEVLEPLFSAAIEPEDVVALSVATRPDCLGQEVLDMLTRLRARKDVWVELGLQTIHDETVRYIRRGYALPVFDEAVAKLCAIGITVIVHQIIGLPGETPEQIAATADYIAHSRAQGVKFHLLYVPQDTDLARDYAAGRFEVLTREAYLPLLADCVRRMPPEMVIHRLTGDGDKRTLLAPLWSGNKKQVLHDIQVWFRDHDVVQGSLFVPRPGESREHI